MSWGRQLADLNRPMAPAVIRTRLELLTISTALDNGVATVCDSLVVDTYAAAEWLLLLEKGTARRVVRVLAVNDGTSGADATAATYTEYGSQDVGTVDVVLSVDLSGAGGAQVMRLVALASSAGWTARAVRLPFRPTAA